MRYPVLVYPTNLRYSANITDCNMDYRQKMVVSTTKKYKNEDDDDEDLEALRLAALQSLRAKPAPSAKPQAPLPHQNFMHTGRSNFAPFNQRFGNREYYYRNRPPKQNGNVYHPSRVNQNLIEIIPVEEGTVSSASENKPKCDPLPTTDATEDSKFHRYTSDISASEDEEPKDLPSAPQDPPLDPPSTSQKPSLDEDPSPDKDNSEKENTPTLDEEAELLEELDDVDDDEKLLEDDDDILLMADLEEEDSLERLMDEMDREMNVQKSPPQKTDKNTSKKTPKDSKKSQSSSKSRKNRVPSKEGPENFTNFPKTERPLSPYTSRLKNRSISPKQKSRKLTRSPPRLTKKSQREPLRLRSPRKSPLRYSPRPRSRSPRLSPHRSPNRSEDYLGRSRSPRRRSRSPKMSHPHSPRFTNRNRSPLRLSPLPRSPKLSPVPRRNSRERRSRSRSPRKSPRRLSPMREPRRTSRERRSRSRSPRISPRRSPRRSPKLSPMRRISPRRSPRASPVRRISPRRSPRLSPAKRLSPRRSPRSSPMRRISPRRSPWSSPRNSPRLSPRRRRSKERKRRSPSPDSSIFQMNKNDNSPVRRNMSPMLVDGLRKGPKENEVLGDPVLEARRRKFESTRPIDPVNANKKIKLSKKDEGRETKEVKNVKEAKDPGENDVDEQDLEEENKDEVVEELCLHDDYDFDDLEPVLSEEETVIVEVQPVKVEKERVKKKKKKDKELYQVGRMKESLAGRVKEKKCKKKKEVVVVVEAPEVESQESVKEEVVDEEADLRTELSRRRAERMNRTVPVQSARLLQSAFKGVVNEVAKNNAKVIQRHLGKAEEKPSKKEVRRVTVLHRTVSDLSDSEDTIDSKMPVRFRLGMNNPVQETRESKVSRKTSKRLGRKGKNLNTH